MIRSTEIDSRSISDVRLDISSRNQEIVRNTRLGNLDFSISGVGAIIGSLDLITFLSKYSATGEANFVDATSIFVPLAIAGFAYQLFCYRTLYSQLLRSRMTEDKNRLAQLLNANF